MTTPNKPSSNRLLSLDTLRGFDMLFIMGFAPLVVVVCELLPCSFTAWLMPQMWHVAWDGFTHHDTIFPLFLFIAGVSFPFSLAKQREKGFQTAKILRKIVVRGFVLVLLGMIYNDLLRFNFDTFRIPSVLGRIGLAWMFAAILYVYFGVKTRIGIAAGILIGYSLLLAFVSAPDVPGALPLSPEGNFAAYIDRLVMPGHTFKPTFDPEGLLGTLPAIVTAMLGMFAGEWVRRPEAKCPGSRKALYMAAGAVVLLVAALLLNPVIPINKTLWSASFVFAAGAYSLAMFALFYYLIDVKKYQRWTFFFKVIGLNSITIYMAQRIVSFGDIAHFFLGGLAGKCSPEIGSLILSCGYVAVCWLFLYFLDRKKTYLKV